MYASKYAYPYTSFQRLVMHIMFVFPEAKSQSLLLLTNSANLQKIKNMCGLIYFQIIRIRSIKGAAYIFSQMLGMNYLFLNSFFG